MNSWSGVIPKALLNLRIKTRIRQFVKIYPSSHLANLRYLPDQKMENCKRCKHKAAALVTIASTGSGSSGMRARSAACIFAVLVVFAVESSQAQPLAIEPMTAVNTEAHTGYFQDPYPVHKAPSNSPNIQVISGTTKAFLSGAYPLQPQSF